MYKEVRILIKTDINYDNGIKESINNQYKGNLYFKDNGYYLKYDENPVKEEKEKCTTILKWNIIQIPAKIILIRQGNIKMKQIFQEGYRYNSSYIGPFGTINLETITNNFNLSQNNNGGEIYLDYNLKLNNQISGNYILEINYIINEVLQ